MSVLTQNLSNDGWTMFCVKEWYSGDPPHIPEHLLEHYDEWAGQTFVMPTHVTVDGIDYYDYSFIVKSVSLLLAREGSPGQITVSMRAVQGIGENNKPTGEDLCSGTTNGDTLPEYPDSSEWRQITLNPPYQIYPTAYPYTRYAIVFHAPNSLRQESTQTIIFGDVQWRFKSMGFGYVPRKLQSNDDTTWDINSQMNGTYIIEGDIVLPEPPAKPINPTPANEATNVSLSQSTITWEDGNPENPADSYDVYFGLTPESLVKLSSEQVGLSFNITGITNGSPFGYSNTRVWRIDAINEVGTTTGDVWIFTTMKLELENKIYGGDKVRLIPFIYSSDIAYVVEFGNTYARFYYGDDVLLNDRGIPLIIETPYLAEHLFQLQYHQVGDVMLLTYPLYAQRKLTRISATSFALTIIPFKKGPFMTRNDLIDPDNPSNITMTSSVTGEPEGVAEYSLTGHGDNYIQNNWWDGVAAHGINGSQADYCGGGRRSDGRPVYITYTVTYNTTIKTLTSITINYINHSYTQETARSIRLWTENDGGQWINVDIADFPATIHFDKPSSLIGLDGTATITAGGPWTNISKIEIYLWATAGKHSTACAIFNVSAGTGEYIPGTLTASSDYFETGHEGALFKLIHKRPVTVITLNHAGYSPPLYTKGTFRFNTHGTWTGTVELQRNDHLSGWDTYRTYIGKNDRNIQESFVEDGDNVQYRIYAHAGITGDFGSDLTLNNVFREGIVRIVSIGDIVYYEDETVIYEDETVMLSSRTVANVAIITPLACAEPTKRWAEGAWSDLRGFPTSVTFFEDRCIYGGMQTILPSKAKLFTIWFSESGDYENFEEGLNADDSFSMPITTTNDIMWIEALEALVSGTSGDEWRIGSNRMEQLISPTNCTARQQSSWGCRNMQAIRVNDQILFVDFVGRKIRELTYNGDKYVSIDLTALAEHITLSGIIGMSLQKNPDTILWFHLGDGSLIGMTYEREQNVIAFHKHPINGYVYSACVIPAENEDEVWLAVRRIWSISYEGQMIAYEDENVTIVDDYIYIEKMAPRVFGENIEDAFFVDSGINFISEAPTTIITNLKHLIGETVSILADGLVQESKVVDNDGRITLDTAAKKKQVGLSYKPVLEPMKPVIETQMGTSAASIVSVKEMGISFLNTAGAKYGASLDNMFDIDFNDPRWTNSSEIDGLFTGTVVVSVDGGFSLDVPLIISSDSPLPLTVRALIPRLEQTGR